MVLRLKRREWKEVMSDKIIDIGSMPYKEPYWVNEPGLSMGPIESMLLGGIAAKGADKVLDGIYASKGLNAALNKVDAYKQMKKFGKTRPNVQYFDRQGSKLRGEYNPSTNTININKNMPKWEQKATMKHEFQHWKDKYRGKSSGYNSEVEGSDAYLYNIGEIKANKAKMGLLDKMIKSGQIPKEDMGSAIKKLNHMKEKYRIVDSNLANNTKRANNYNAILRSKVNNKNKTVPYKESALLGGLLWGL